MAELSGKSVVITGAGRGIGAACARAIAASGANVVVNDISADAAEASAAAIRKEGLNAVAHACDISAWDQAERLVARCVEAFGTIDGLVNNAGLFSMDRVDELKEAELRSHLAVNVVGTIAMTTFAVRQMLARGSGSIVNIASGAMLGSARMSIYGATKGAVASFTYSAAIDLVGTGVRVNAVCPRAQTVMTETMTDYVRRHASESQAGKPMAARPEPEANAPPMCYLLSDLSSKVNGQIFIVDGQSLSLVNHPTVSVPLLEQPSWTASVIAKEVERILGAHMHPPGVTGLDRDTGKVGLIRRGEMARS